MAIESNEDIIFICRLYREALDKEKQILILSQLFAVPAKIIKRILITSGDIGNKAEWQQKYFNKLYDKGMTDYQIALVCHSSRATIRNWRIASNLKPNLGGEKHRV